MERTVYTISLDKQKYPYQVACDHTGGYHLISEVWHCYTLLLMLVVTNSANFAYVNDNSPFRIRGLNFADVRHENIKITVNDANAVKST